MGKVATSPLPPRGSPPLQSGGQNQKWPINGEGGHITLAAAGIRTGSERGAKSEVAHKWARWLRHPCRLGDLLRFKAGGKIRNVQKRDEMQRHPSIMGGPWLPPPPKMSEQQRGGFLQNSIAWGVLKTPPFFKIVRGGV